jgi:hypothetical protein
MPEGPHPENVSLCLSVPLFSRFLSRLRQVLIKLLRQVLIKLNGTGEADLIPEIAMTIVKRTVGGRGTTLESRIAERCGSHGDRVERTDAFNNGKADSRSARLFRSNIRLEHPQVATTAT